MGWFKSKKKEKLQVENINEENKKNTKVQSKDKFHYRVYIKEIEDSYTKKVSHFGVERYIDEEKGTVMLRNEVYKFNEPKPSNEKAYKIYKIAEVDLKIKELEGNLSKEIKKDDPKVNRKDIEEELGTYKSIKRSLELQGKGSYLNVDEDGTPYFVFRRKGNFKLPEFDNVDIDTIYTPSEAKIKKGSELLDMKREKYSKYQKTTATIMTLLVVLLIFWSGANAWWGFKLNALSDASIVTQLQNQMDETALYCAEKYGEAGENFYESSLYIKNITETIYRDMNKEQFKIEGITPEWKQLNI